MIFSELSLIEKETGLKYDPETATLSGVKNGVPVVVFDNDKKHRFDIVCGAVITERQFGRIYIMAERFPKKTMLGIENVDGCVNIYCKGYNLMQENLPLLIEFLEKLTAYLKSEMRKTTHQHTLPQLSYITIIQYCETVFNVTFDQNSICNFIICYKAQVFTSKKS